MEARDIISAVREAGVVGAGGAGFPTHVKLSANVDTVLVNGAECEPLLHKDKELMRYSAPWVVEGVVCSMAATGAGRGIVALKKKAKEAVSELRRLAERENSVDVYELGDFYPAGDELVLAAEVCGRVVPFGKLPMTQGLVISNSETMIWIARAQEGIPVTHKTLTINGAVAQPITITVPVGVTLSECISAAGGPTCDDPVVISGGIMMGKIARDLSEPVTKTTSGLIVLPPDHPLGLKKGSGWNTIRKTGHSACDSCSYCTEFCPRYLLGHPVRPHLVMRTLGMSSRQADEMYSDWARGCVECGLCGMFSCPEELRPDAICGRAKRALPRERAAKSGGLGTMHPARPGRRVPIKKLVARTGLKKYDVPAPLSPLSFSPQRVRLLMSQHIGAPAVPVVKAGSRVKAGDLIGEIPENALGAKVHSSISGKVVEVNEKYVLIES